MKISNEPIHVVFGIDEAFAPFCGVCMLSILQNTTHPVKFHIIHPGLSHATKQKLLGLVDSIKSSLAFHSLRTEDLSSLSTLPVDGHVSIATYFRILTPRILENEATRCIYIDADTLVIDDLEKLWLLDLGVYAFAAKPEAIDPENHTGIDPGFPYLNAGVLLIDIGKWNEADLSNCLLKKATEATPAQLRYWDQDLIALTCHGNWHNLPSRWNLTEGNFQVPKEELNAVSLDAGIVHFTGAGIKPWQRYTNHSFDSQFWHYAEKAKQFGFLVPKPAMQSVRQRFKVFLNKHLESFLTKLFKLNNSKLLRVFAKIVDLKSDHEARQEEAVRRLKTENLVAKYFPENRVISGPFAGLLYPSIDPFGRMFLPKLAGTYEAELHGIFEEIHSNMYEHIVDVGCAEGFYTVGMALRYPSAQIIAYDSSAVARKLTNDLAVVNNAAGRIIIKETFFISELFQICHGKNLAIIDAGGFENDIIKSSLARDAFVGWDLLIECHDFLCPLTTAKLSSFFEPTHEITVIRSVADIFRPSQFLPSELSECSYDESFLILAERRPDEMRWIFARSKSSKGTN